MTLLKQSGVYGATVGHRTVFTRNGAMDRYKMFLEVCYNNLDMAGAKVLGEVETDMIKIGFTPTELEEIEIEYLKSLN